MRRPRSPFLAAAVLASVLASSAVHATPPSGSVSCPGVTGRLSFPARGLPTVNNPAPPRTTTLAIKGATTGICDASAVVGGRFPIVKAFVSLRGRTVEGETCGDFFGTLDLQKTKLAVKWRGANPNASGRLQTIAASKAIVASAVHDSGVLVIVTEPIAHGAFAGSTLTFRLGVGAVGSGGFEESCNTVDASYASILFGSDGTSTIAAP